MSELVTRSFAWKYFIKNVDEETAKCTKCDSVLKCKGWSTSGLLRHLKRKHNILNSLNLQFGPSTSTEHSVRKRTHKSNDVGEAAPQYKKACPIEKEETLNEIVSKLVCVDGFTVNAITKSEFIRNAINDKGYSLPANPCDVMKLIYEYYDLVKAEINISIKSKLEAGQRCSLTLDEYTSLKNRRYLNINIHFSEGAFYNLGMVRVLGSFSAEKCVAAVEMKLTGFGVNIEKHVVACVTDGASMMVKFGKIIGCAHHMCYAHAIHLAVCDVLYKKQVDLTESANEIEEDNIHESEEETDEFEELREDLSHALDMVVGDTTESDGSVIFRNFNEKVKATTNINETLSKVRRIVKMFKKSPLKNDILQQHVRGEFGCELVPILDTKTRWNSLLAMLERFLEIKSAISKALIDTGEQQNLNSEELKTLAEIVLCLKPVKMGLEKLCNRNSNLMTAEGVFDFIFSEVNQLNSGFSKDMKLSLEKRLNERRNVSLIALMQYLNLGKKYNKTKVLHVNFPKFPKRSAVIHYAQTVFTRLFSEGDEFESNSSQSEDENTEIAQKNVMILKERLDNAIQIKTKVMKCSNNVNYSLKTIVKQELQLFDSTTNRSSNIDKLAQALKTIPPSSVEAERAFSSAGLFITKLRTKLSDKSIDCLCFLRTYLQNK